MGSCFAKHHIAPPPPPQVRTCERYVPQSVDRRAAAIRSAIVLRAGEQPVTKISMLWGRPLILTMDIDSQGTVWVYTLNCDGMTVTQMLMVVREALLFLPADLLRCAGELLGALHGYLENVAVPRRVERALERLIDDHGSTWPPPLQSLSGL